MRKIFYVLVATLTAASCGGGNETSVEKVVSDGNLETLLAKKAELAQQSNTLQDQIKVLDSAIATKSGEEKLPLVTTVTANTENFNHFLELQGNVQTKQNVLIYPEMAGTLQNVYVKEGQRVSKGQVLATIDDGGMSSQLAQLETQTELSKTTYERQKRLWEQNIGSEIQYLQAKTNYEAQQSNIKQLRSQLDKSTIRAPFSGIIDDVIRDQGTVVAPGQGSEVFRIVNLSNMYIDVEVPESYLGSITNGKEATVYFPILGDTIATKIRQTGNYINPSNRSFTVQVPVPNKEGRIKPNLTARVRLNDYSNEEAILIPSSIISENATGDQYAYVADELNDNNEAVVKRSIITTGKTQNGRVEVLSGLSDGDHVVKEGARSVKDGQKVKVLEQ